MFEYLKRDAVSHADMLDPLYRGTGEVIYEGEDGVIFREMLSGIYFASMEDVEKCLAVLGKYPVTAFAVHQERTAKMLQQRHHFPEYHPCHQYVYPADTFGEAEMKHAGIDSCRLEQVQLLGAEYRDIVDRNYDAMDDPEYIGELIERKQLWGIFEQGELAGFIGQHLEGSMGLLEVLPQYRNKGYGKILEVFLIRRTLSQGRRPFCQVFEGNEASARLQERLGMVCSSEKTWWLFGGQAAESR